MITTKTAGTIELGSPNSWLHFRRCHRCGESQQASATTISKCESCGVPFAPFFFAEHTPESMTFIGPRKPQPFAGLYRPVVGVSWWWSEDVADLSLLPRT